MYVKSDNMYFLQLIDFSRGKKSVCLILLRVDFDLQDFRIEK